MSAQKTFGVKVSINEKNFLDDICNKVVEKENDVNNKREALLRIFNDYAYQILDNKPEVSRKFELENIEDICELGFLQKLIDPKDGIIKYFCLRTQDPTKKGKPILMSDGADILSIKKICDACKTGYVFNRQNKLGDKAIETIKKFGEQKLEILMCACRHPQNDYIQIKLGDKGTFYCKIKEARASINRTCISTNCDFLYMQSAPIQIKETTPYKEMKKELEDMRE